MASKFGGIVAQLSTANTPPAPAEKPLPVADKQPETKTDWPPPSITKMHKKRGRPPGKKSSPEYEQTTVFLRKESKWEALRYTFDRSLDLSTLINTALDEWLARQTEGPYANLRRAGEIATELAKKD